MAQESGRDEGASIASMVGAAAGRSTGVITAPSAPPLTGPRPGEPRPWPGTAASGGLPEPSALRAWCAAAAERHGVPGAQIAIARHGHVVTVETGALGHGTDQHGTDGRVSADGAFPIGSLTKTFTATLVATLADEGDLDLSAPVGEYLPYLDRIGAEVTLHHLLSHTSGLPAGPDSDDVAAVSARRYLTEYCRRADLLFPPGTGFSYSNAGYVLTGAVIEAVTGMSWSEALASIVLRPLDIEPAFLGTGRADRPVATGHSVSGSGRARPVRFWLAPVEAPAGALAASAADLVRLGRALIDPAGADALPAQQAAQMRRPVLGAEPFGLADGWGLGLAWFHHGGRAWIGHDGNADGTACYLRADPVGGWVVALTSNANTGAGLWRDLCAELRIGLVGQAVRPGAPLAPPRECPGTYANGGIEFVVSARDGRLVLAVDDEAPLPITVHEGLVFTVPEPTLGATMVGGRFVRDPYSGQIDGLQIGGRLARRRSTVRDAGRHAARTARAYPGDHARTTSGGYGQAAHAAREGGRDAA